MSETLKKPEEQKKEKKNGIIAKIKSIKNIEIYAAILLGLLAILIFFGNFNFGGDNAAASYSDSYVAELESKMAKSLSKVKNAGKVEVVLTVEGGMKTVLACTTTTTSETVDGITKVTETTAPVMVNGKPMVLMEAYPEVIGVIIVAQGADDLWVKNQLVRACQSLCNVKAANIEVFTMKK